MKSRMCAIFLLAAGSAAAQIESDHCSHSADKLSVSAQEFPAQARPSSDFGQNYVAPASALVSAASLEVPASAQKEFEKANDLLTRRQKLNEALRRLKKVVAIDPSFAPAYNNLAVAYARRGDTIREREALQEAIRLNDHFALAYANVGRMNLAANDFPDAAVALRKALDLDPGEPASLILMSYAELMQGNFDGAIAETQKAHALTQPHAPAHRVAARAFERENQIAFAIVELQVFLAEEPFGPTVESACKELATLRALSH
jgi:tetratricopeptide (TPR) repeat protein